MKTTWVISISCMIMSKISCSKIDSLSFPDGLKFGVATSAYQIEGAWNISDKGENIWDRWVHINSSAIADHSTADVACNSYYKYKEDVQWIKHIGFDYYRFSISWTRILPTGFANKVSKDGIQYYKNLIGELLANGIEPVVTLIHFDHPQILEDMGGWTNELMVNWFVDYAKIIFKEFGSSIKIFTTINEPQILCKGYQGLMNLSPGKYLLDVGVYLCLHNVLKAHAKAYHMYDKEFRPTQNGQIALSMPCMGWVMDDSNDTVAAETAFQFDCGILAHPIYIGDYPPIVKSRIAKISKLQGYPVSRLPRFSPKWISYIRGTTDYFALNHYSSNIATPDPDEKYGKYNSDAGIILLPENETSQLGPEGFGNLMRKIKTEYGNPPVYILENGFSDSGSLKDCSRINYFYSYLKELIKLVKQDGCHVLRYTIWSLLDNFEISRGYTYHFGIVSVDFNSTSRHRRSKLSSGWWKTVIKARKLVDVPHKKGC